MFNTYHPKVHLDRAKKLLLVNDDNNFYYVCLELRFCIEALTYLHVANIFDNFTPTYMREWAPNKLIKKLSRLEPLFEGETKLEIKLSRDIDTKDTPWIKLGSQTLPKATWLAKNYNKLGNALHICQPNKAIEYGSELKPEFDLKIMIDELSTLVESNLILTFTEYYKHKCALCGEEILLTKHLLSNNDYVECDNQKCLARHSITKFDENSFILDIYDGEHFKCQTCGDILFIPQNKIKEDCKFRCQCGEEYEFILMPIKCSDS